MMPPDALETLRQVNDNLRSALIYLRPERTQCSAIRAQHFSDLRHQLLRAGECLRCKPSNAEVAVALAEELVEYRRNLERLKRFLPDVYVRLLAEKSRLEAARTHVTAATAWRRASQHTL